MTPSVCLVCSFRVHFLVNEWNAITTESVHVKLTDEEIRYLEEPYRPKEIIGHS